MNRPSLSLILFVIFSTDLLWAVNGIAHEGGVADDSYVGDGRHHVVVPGSGGCLRTGSWTAGQQSANCGGRGSIVLDASALFDTNKAVIKEKARGELNALAADITAATDVKQVNIIGHTDSKGSDAYNMDLSVRRANAVKSYLVKKGVNPESIVTSGKGETSPVASNDTAKGRAMNRRVEINLERRAVGAAEEY